MNVVQSLSNNLSVDVENYVFSDSYYDSLLRTFAKVCEMRETNKNDFVFF